MSIFISYAKEDTDSVKRIYFYLKNKNLDPWLDKYSITAGEDWEVSIENAIENSNFFIAVISRASIKKMGVVQKELRLALKKMELVPETSIYLIPVRIEECNVNNRALKRLHWIDMFPVWQEGESKILSAIDRNHDKKQKERKKHNIELLLSLAKTESKKVFHGGYTNLMMSSFEGKLELVQFWVDNGADINAKKYDGDTALSLAISANQVEVADLLLKNGAKIHDKVNYNNWSYLRQAVFEASTGSCSVDMVKTILDYGANINELDDSGYSALNEAASFGSLDVVKHLIGRGALLDATDREGETALLQAARYGYVEVARFLLESGADYFQKNKEGKTVLDIATQECDERSESMINFLVQWNKN